MPKVAPFLRQLMGKLPGFTQNTPKGEKRRERERDGRGEQRGRRRAPGRGGAGGKGPRGRVITCFRLGGAQRGRKTRPGGRAGRWLPYVGLRFNPDGALRGRGEQRPSGAIFPLPPSWRLARARGAEKRFSRPGAGSAAARQAGGFIKGKHERETRTGAGAEKKTAEAARAGALAIPGCCWGGPCASAEGRRFVLAAAGRRSARVLWRETAVFCPPGGGCRAVPIDREAQIA